MNNNLNSIMLILKSGLDSSQNVTSMDAVVDAIGQLETFPMTMSQLQDSRIGQLLQTIRHKVDPSLQKRIRFIIKAWQKLLSPGLSVHSVIPLKCLDTNSMLVPTPRESELKKSNGTSSMVAPRPPDGSAKQLLAAVKSMPVSQSSGCLEAVEPGMKRSIASSKSQNILSKAFDSPLQLVNHESPTPPKRCQNQLPVKSVNKRQCKMSVNSFNSSDRASPLLNGGKLLTGSPDVRSGKYLTPASKPSTSLPLYNYNSGTPSRQLAPVGNSFSLTQMFTPPPSAPSQSSNVVPALPPTANRLSKVKSTAELVQAAGDCIDSATVDRILTNRITKEVDPPRITTVAALVGKPRLSRANSSCIHQTRGPATPSTRRSDANLTVKQTSATSVNSDFKSGGCPTFAKQDIGCSLLNEASELNRSDEKPASFVVSGEKVTHDGDLKMEDQHVKLKKLKQKKKKHKHHHHNKQPHDSTKDDEYGDRDNSSFSPSVYRIPPTTNHLNDWPLLPPQPDQIDWHSLDRSQDNFLLPELNVVSSANVDRLVFGTWPGVNCTEDDGGRLRRLTELYSVALDNQYLHILPWVDIVDHRRQYFPSIVSEELDRLTNLPDPW